MDDHDQGYTLLEMSIVLVIIAVVMAGGAITFVNAVQRRQLDDTSAKLAVLQKRLLDYRRTFMRLPCPADIKTYNTADAYFGRAARHAVLHASIGCHAPSDAAPQVTYLYNITANGTAPCSASEHCIFGGMVPTKTLGLPDEYAFDGWGRRILYAVDSDFAKTDAFLVQSDVTADASSDTTRITIQNTHAYNTTPAAIYVLISFGRDGHGAYPRDTVTIFLPDDNGDSITQISPRITSGVTNPMTLTNCHCTSTGVDDIFLPTFVHAQASYEDGSPANRFDDLVAYATRGGLLSAAE